MDAVVPRNQFTLGKLLHATWRITSVTFESATTLRPSEHGAASHAYVNQPNTAAAYGMGAPSVADSPRMKS